MRYSITYWFVYNLLVRHLATTLDETRHQWLEADEFAPILSHLDFRQSPDLFAEKLLISAYLDTPNERNRTLRHLIVQLRDTYNEHGEITVHLDEILNTDELVMLLFPNGLPDPIRLGGLRKAITKDVLERPPHKVQSLTNLAKEYQHQRNYEQELALQEAEYDALKGTLGVHHPDTINSLKTLARKNLRSPDKAQTLYKEVLALQKEILGPLHLEIVLTLGDFASAHEAGGQHKQARLLHDEAIVICKELFGENHLHTAKAMIRLGDNYEEEGMLQQSLSLPLYEAALEVFVATLGRRHSDTAVVLGKLGSVHRSLKDWDQAFALYEEELSIYRETLGDHHHFTVRHIDHLGYLYRKGGEYRRALPLIKEALEFLPGVIGENHRYIQRLREEYEQCRQALASQDGSTGINV